MAEKTKIQWCAHTFNPWIGCTKVAEGCKFCYAEELMANRYHRVKWGPSGTRSRTKTWNDPVKWDRKARERSVREKVFCASLADVFEDREELIPWRTDLFHLIDRCPNLHWLLLTKRPENISGMWPDERPRENVWLGTSIAHQKDVPVYVPPLREVKGHARFLFLSVEPQIGPVDLGDHLPYIDWVILGGESKQGPNQPRPYDMDWARFSIDQCREAGVACFLKQLGSVVLDGGSPLVLRDGHGGDMGEWPEELRVRECPESYAEPVGV